MSAPVTKSPDCECVDCKCVDCTCTKGECKCPGCGGNTAEAAAAAPPAEAGKGCCGCEKPADCGTCTSGGCSCGENCKCCT